MPNSVNTEAIKQVTSLKSFDIDSVQYREPKVNARGGKNVAVHYGGKKLLLQIPLTFSWGAQEHEDENSGNKSYSMNLSLENDSTLFSKIKAFEDKVIADAITNSKKWFGKAKMTEEVIDALFYKILKFPKNKETDEPDRTRNPSMKIKIPFWDGKFAFAALFNMNRDTIYSQSQGVTDVHPLDLIPARSYVGAVIECGGVWFAAGRFGVTWKLVQGKVKPPVTMDGYCMLDDPEEEAMVNQINKKECEKLENVEEVSFQNEELPDTEDEAEPVKVEAAVPEPEEKPAVPEPEEKPAPKKKKVVRKKKSAA